MGYSCTLESGIALLLAEFALPLKTHVHSLGVLLGGMRDNYQFRPSRIPFWGLKDPAIVTHALVTSRLNCYSMFYVGRPLKTVWKLQPRPNSTAWLWGNASRIEHVSLL